MNKKRGITLFLNLKVNINGLKSDYFCFVEFHY